MCGAGHDRKQFVDHGLGLVGDTSVDLAVTASPGFFQGDGTFTGLHVPDDLGENAVLDGTHLVAYLVGPCARGPRQLLFEALVFLVAFHQALDSPHESQVHILAAFGGIAVDVGQVDAFFRQVAVGFLAVSEREQVFVAVGCLGAVACGVADYFQTRQMLCRAAQAAHVARGVEDAWQVLGHVARFKAALGPGREHHAEDLFRVSLGELAGFCPGQQGVGEVRSFAPGGGGGPLGQGGQGLGILKGHTPGQEGPAHGPRAVQRAAATGHDLLVQCPQFSDARLDARLGTLIEGHGRVLKILLFAGHRSRQGGAAHGPGRHDARPGIHGPVDACAQPLPQTGGLSGDGLHAGRDAVQRAAQAPGLGIGLGQGLSGSLAAAGHVLQAAGGTIGLLLDAARAVAAGKGSGGLARVTGGAAHAFHGIPGLGGLFGHTAHAAFCRARGGTHGIHGLFSRAGEVVPQGELHLYVKIGHATFSIAASPGAC